MCDNLLKKMLEYFAGRRVALTAIALACFFIAPSLEASAGGDTPLVSGLGWRSGAKQGECLAAMRGRPLDVNHTFLAGPNFEDMVRQSGGWLQGEARKAPLWLISMALLAKNTRGQFSECAAGRFDGYFRQIGANLARAGAQGTVVLPGWEANLGSRSHDWGVDRADQIPAYKACWRRAAASLKQGGPGLRTDFNSAKMTVNTSFKTLDLYPGNDVVDGWSIQFYDNSPVKSTQAIWDQDYNSTFRGDLRGLGTWLAAAKAYGKKLGIAEWGVWRQPPLSAAQADDPVYIENMNRFFRANAASISYEAYHNSMPEHWLCSARGTPFPSAAARYKAVWSAGAR